MLRITVCPPCYGFDRTCLKLADGDLIVDVSTARKLSEVTSKCRECTDHVVIAHMDVPTILEWLNCRNQYALRTVRSKVYNVLSTLLNEINVVDVVVYSQVFLDFVPGSIASRASINVVRVKGSAEPLLTWPPYGPCPEVHDRVTIDEMERRVRDIVERSGSRILSEIASKGVRTVRTQYLSATEILENVCDSIDEFMLGTRMLDALEVAGVLTSRNVGYRTFSWSPAVVLGRSSEIIEHLLDTVVETEGRVFHDRSREIT